MSRITGAEWDGCRQELERVRETLRIKGAALREAFRLSVWRTEIGELAPNEAAEHSANWPEGRLVYIWAPRDGARMFYRRLEVPAEFMGIALTGSAVELELWMNTGTTVYVNGQIVYQADYWSDTQVVPVPLTPSVDKDDRFDLFLQCKQGDGFGYFPIADIRIAAVDEWIFELDTFQEELGFVSFIIENGDVGDEYGRVVGVLTEALSTFDYGALEANEWERVADQLRGIRSKLAFVREYAKTYRIHLIAHAHIDMNWLWPWGETVSLIVRDFESMLNLMEQYPQVRFSHSQAATYRVVQEQYPELWERLLRQVELGAWEVTAATWVEGDLNMGGYETLVRQFLQGKSYVREQFGVDPVLCWEPDTFGHPATMPGVLAGAGIRYYYHTRGGRGVPVYWWEGAEGSRVLVFNDPSPNGYNGRIFASEVMSSLTYMTRTYGLKTNMYVFGIGDHGGGATRQDIERAIRLDASPLLPRFKFSKAVEFYEELELSGARFPVLRGELNPVFAGCYTSHGDIKKANRRTEHALVKAEALSSIADLYSLSKGKLAAENWTGRVLAGEGLLEAWRTQCFHQFHDIVCGCSIEMTYAEAVPAAAEVETLAEEAGRASIRSSLTASERPNFSGAKESTIVVYNTLSWERTDTVVLKQAECPGSETWRDGDWLEDAGGQCTPIQIAGDDILFVARNVPAFGFTVYRYHAADESRPRSTVSDIRRSVYNNPVLDIGRYRVEIDRESGTIVELKDQISDRSFSYPLEWTDRLPKGKLNVLEVQEEVPHGMSAWIIGAIAGSTRLIDGAEVKVLHQGPVFQSVEVRHRYRESEIRQEIRVYRELDRIDFRTTVDWRESGSGTQNAPMLKVLFTPHVMATEHTFNVPFGALARPADGMEMPALHWIDVSESAERGQTGIGMSLLNDGKYGHSIQGNTMALTLIRSSYEPDNRADVGLHEFTYSIYPHAGSWVEASTDRRGWELNQPMMAMPLKGAITTEDAETFCALSVEQLTTQGWTPAPGTVVTAFKPSEAGGSSITVRLVQMHGVATRLRLVLPVSAVLAEETDLLERPLRTLGSGQEQRIEIGAMSEGAIRTFRLVFGSRFGASGDVSVTQDKEKEHGN